jgi:potassium voltage-gated channel Eag-related subfamily H protein 8
LTELNYLKSCFTIDILTTESFDMMCLFSVSSGQECGFSYIDLLKLMRLVRIARQLRKVKLYNQYSAIIIILLMLFFAFLLHWLACMWYVLAEMECQRSDEKFVLALLKSLGTNDCCLSSLKRNVSLFHRVLPRVDFRNGRLIC